MGYCSDLRCDLCESPLPSFPSDREFAEEILDNPNYKFAWILLDDKKHLCKNCVLDILNEANDVGLIDWDKQKTHRARGGQPSVSPKV